MLARTLDQFIDETSLLPHLIGEGIAREGGLDGDAYAFGQYVTWRTLTLYNCNPRWRAQVRLDTSREYVAMFARHWLPAWQARRAEGQRAPQSA